MSVFEMAYAHPWTTALLALCCCFFVVALGAMVIEVIRVSRH